MKNILLTFLVLIGYQSNCQHLVDSFNMPTPKNFASIDEIKVAPDNKILLAGDMDFHNGTEVQNLIRLNVDGSLDSDFQFSYKKNINKIEFLSTGEIIALDSDSLYMINEFGTIVNSLYLGVSTGYSDFGIKSDFIFLLANGLGLRKYDANFTLVTDFNNDNLFENGIVRTLAFQNDKILVSGSFSSVNGIAKNDIARFDSDGNLDETFDTGLGTSDPLNSMVIQDDNKIILSESYINSFNGISCNGLARLNEDGSVDLEFLAPIINSHTGSNVALLNDQILVTESYFIGDDRHFRLVKLNLDGTLNSSFELNDYSSKIALLPGGDILINTDALKKYSNEGTIDSDFDPLLERIGYINNAAFHDNFIIVTGDFYSLDGIVTNQIGKIDFNGNVDSNFIFTNEVTHETFPRQVKVIEENEIFISFGDKLLKLDNFGNPAPDFNTPEEVIKPSGKTDSYFAEKFEFLSNDKIVIAGPNGLYILNEDGSQDTSFDFENTSDISYSNFTLGLQSTGKIIYESELSEVNNIEVNKMVRVNTDGSLDLSFDIGEGHYPYVSYFNVTPNDELIVGSFEFNGLTSKLGIYKLGVDGALDLEYLNNINTSFEKRYFFIDGQNFKGNSLLFTFIDFDTNELSVGKIDNNGMLIDDFLIDEDIKIEPLLPQASKALFSIPVGNKKFLLLGDFTLNLTDTKTKGLMFVDNDLPVIITSSPISTPEETPLVISLDDITVVDPDNDFPSEFTLSVSEGVNYTVSNNQIIPVENFNGTLSVPITVNDGLDDSEPYLLSIDVTAINDIPEITAAVSLSTPEETPLLILIEDLTVVDPDNDFPTDFTISILEGNNYTVSNNQIIPVENFNGALSVPITVNDGLDDSEPYLLFIDVTAINDIPEITVVTSLSTQEETPLFISLDDITVSDPDNEFPTDFTLTTLEGDNYSVSNNQIIPVENFNGLLSVPIIVNDGTDDSQPYTLIIDVIAINDIPVITGTVSALFTPEDTPLLISLNHFNIEDPDNEFPTDFTLSILEGDNYIVSGKEVIPMENFNGSLTVSITVNDGTDDSLPYMLIIEVTPVLSVSSDHVQVLIYPNPTNSHLILENLNQVKCNEVLIYDLKGVLRFQKSNLEQDNLIINVESMPEGVYILILKNDKNPVIKKFIKI